MDEGSWLSWLIIALLVAAAAYFATAETAYSSVSRIKIKSEMDRGDSRAKKALLILDNFDKAITTILIGTNIVHIVTAALVTIMVTKKWGVSAVTISTIITTLVIFFVGEMLPKSIGKKYSGRFSLSFASSLSFFMLIFKPLAYILTKVGQSVARHTKGDPEVTVTEDELYDIIENMKEDGELDAERGELVHSAMMFADVTVESIVTPRVDLVAIDIETPLTEMLKFVKASRHSRFPVYEGSIDNVIGVLQIRKFIKSYIKQGDELDVRSALDNIHFAHQSTKIDELLSEMSRKRLNMAIVTDNYGGTLGIVTVEDILEELVGDIWDEDDEIKEFCVMQSDGSYELDPELGIEESFDLVDFEDPDDFEFEHKLLGEWVFEHFDRIPTEGDSFVYNGLTVTVKEMRQNRIVKLNMKMLTESNEEGGNSK
ncbi:MAG: HlyC/CorC family transporter [Oscillospiraceae bacterium]|nr:HlyC/CorC family transporter [Oscillospiraceae bacterium]